MAKKTNDFELSEEAKAAGLRMGPHERITDEDRAYAKVKNEKLDNSSIVDKYRNFNTHPEAKAFRVSSPRKTELSELEELARTSEPKEELARTSEPKYVARQARAAELSENERLGKLAEKLGGNRVGFIPPSNTPLNQPDKNMRDLLANKKGGVIKKASGGVTRSSASKRADGCAKKGYTRA
jgi:hypothetical protein